MTASGSHEANQNNTKTIAYELIITGTIVGVCAYILKAQNQMLNSCHMNY